MSVMKKPTVLFERFPYRYVECGTLEINGMQTIVFKKQTSTPSVTDMYLLDNRMQLGLLWKTLNTRNGWIPKGFHAISKTRYRLKTSFLVGEGSPSIPKFPSS